jgi:quercetin 2,3-dioxygenase
MDTRSIKRLHDAMRDDIADLVTRRPLPGAGLSDLDPFLFLNHHGPQTYQPGNRGLPFGPHPHRGFETVTFILEGELAHSDSGGHENVIHAGGVQWMTAGRGLVHAELSPESFRRAGGPLEILQLWVNLPARLKMTEPAYVGLEAADIPVVEQGGARIALVAGRLCGAEGPVKPLTGLEIMVVTLEPGGAAELPVAQGRAILLYVVRGSAEIAGQSAPEHRLVELTEEGAGVSVRSEEGAMLLFGHGEPCGEPIVVHGPFVMNTQQEIVEAIRDYQTGRFGGL